MSPVPRGQLLAFGAGSGAAPPPIPGALRALCGNAPLRAGSAGEGQ